MDRRYVGIDLHRRPVGDLRDGRRGQQDVLRTDRERRVAVARGREPGRRRRGGGDRGNVWLVLGGRSAPGRGVQRASGAPVRERLGAAAGGKARTRRAGSGRPVAPRTGGGGGGRATRGGCSARGRSLSIAGGG